MGTTTHHWAWFTFFVVQVPLLALEGVGRKWMKQHSLQVPQWLSVLVTMAVLLWLADAFFFPPCIDTGLADRVVETIKVNINQLVRLVS